MTCEQQRPESRPVSDNSIIPRGRSTPGSSTSANRIRLPFGCVAAVAVLACEGNVATAGIIYDAAANFNGTQGGTNGVWQYGRLDAAGGNFTQASYNGSWAFASDVTVGASYMHPGGYFTGARANLRFTAPTAGDYTATFSAKLTDYGNNPYIANYDFRRDGVRMWLNNSSFFDLQTWDAASQPLSFQFQTLTQTFTLAAGQTIDFSIDPNGAYGHEWGRRENNPGGAAYLGYNINDSTQYTAAVALIPTPGAAALLGLGGLLAARRRR